MSHLVGSEVLQEAEELAVVTNGDKLFRLYSPLGSYPNRSLRCMFGDIVIAPESVASVVDNNHLAQKHHTLLSVALLLATQWESSFTRLYHFPFEHELTLDQNMPSSSVLETAIIESIKEKREAGFTDLAETIPEFDKYQNAKGASLPLALGGTLYHLQENSVDESLFELVSLGLYEIINDETWMLGIDFMLSSNRMSCHHQFQAESGHFLCEAMQVLLPMLQESQRLRPCLADFMAHDYSKTQIHEFAKHLTPLEYNRYWTALCQSLMRYFSR